MFSAKWVVLWSLWLESLVRQPTLEVHVSGGRLRGNIARDGSHAQYLAIPYATVRRFQEPGPEPTWDGVMDATDENIKCSQRLTSTMVTGQEDCLILNVFTPLQASTRPRPVMVFIHGGGFRDGSSSTIIYGPEYFVKHDIILVTFNYRLEILGFLCLGIEEAPGNVGLKDQTAALKWVKRNIAAFGGDPDNVTIFGESAGSASVVYHLLSSMSAGLFHKAIMQSGSAISPWSLQFEPLNTASKLASMMGHSAKDPHEIHRLFLNRTDKVLLSTRVPRSDGDIVLSENIFVPCIEKKISNIESFLPDSPYNLLLNGLHNKVPIIIGFNSAEGLMFAGKENDTTIAKLDIYKSLPRDLTFPAYDEKIKIANKLKELYMDNENITKSNIAKFAPFEGDTGIIYPVVITTHLLLRANNRPIYAYKFAYGGWLNMAKIFYGFYKEFGATHADELFYMFKPKIPLLFAFLESEMIEKMTTMWTNFAKYGNPTPNVTSLLPLKWQPAQQSNPHLLVIDKEFSTESIWSDEKIKFWNMTYAKYRRKF